MSEYSLQDFEADSNYLYDYLRDLRSQESEAEFVIQHLRILFIHGMGYPEPDITRAIDRLVNSCWAAERFSYVLNHCCYIFINRWWLQSEFRFKQDTQDLVLLFQETSPLPAIPSVQRLRSLVKHFTQTPHYTTLKRYVQVAGKDTEAPCNVQARPTVYTASGDRLSNLIYRYPCLYPFYIQNSTSNELGRKAVKQRQAYREQKFEAELFGFATKLFSAPPSGRSTLAGRLTNPTLLNDHQLRDAIQHFAGKSSENLTYRASALQFLKTAGQASSLRTVKEQMHEYLTASVQPSSYSKHFRGWLQEQLQMTSISEDDQKPNAFLMHQLCSQLVDAIVANPNPEQPQKHGIFISLHANLGPTSMIGLLLKIVLLGQWLGRSAKDILESIKARIARQFATLFQHYENQVVNDAKWLIDCLDNLLVAFAIHFGHQDYRRWALLL